MRSFVLASGPSLTPEQIERVRTAEGEKIAVNSTIFAAPWADVCFAMDHHWWKQYGEQVKPIGCEMWTSSPNSTQFGPRLVKKNKPDGPLTDGVAGNNSGTVAAELAYLRGADEIVLLGVDCQLVDGKAHHHADHPSPLKNPVRTEHWAESWGRFLKHNDVRVINCSPVCNVEGFEYMTLGEYLGD